MPTYRQSDILREFFTPADLRRRFDTPFYEVERRIAEAKELATTVPSIADLSAVDDSIIPTDTIRYVLGVGYYTLDKSSTETADEIVYVSTASGEGLWVLSLEWRDLQGDISQGANLAALIYEPYRDTSFNMYFMQHNQPDHLSMRYQFQHDRVPGTPIRPHMHFIPMAAGTGNFVLDYKYVFASVDDEVPAAIEWTSTQLTRPITLDEQYKHVVFDFGIFTPQADVLASTMLLVDITRNVAADTYETSKVGGTPSANIGLLSLDVHYQSSVSKNGTDIEFPSTFP